MPETRINKLYRQAKDPQGKYYRKNRDRVLLKARKKRATQSGKEPVCYEKNSITGRIYCIKARLKQ